MKLAQEVIDSIRSIQVGDMVRVVVTSNDEVAQISSVVAGIFEVGDEVVFRFACGNFPASVTLDDETGVSFSRGKKLYTEKYGQSCTIEKS